MKYLDYLNSLIIGGGEGGGEGGGGLVPVPEGYTVVEGLDESDTFLHNLEYGGSLSNFKAPRVLKTVATDLATGDNVCIHIRYMRSTTKIGDLWLLGTITSVMPIGNTDWAYIFMSGLDWVIDVCGAQETATIDANGTHSVYGAQSVTVNVPTGGADNPFIPAASEGYTEYQNACVSPWNAVNDASNYTSATAYINVTKGLGNEIAVGDKVLFTGTVTGELTYAVWGQVSQVITTPTQYDRIVLTDHKSSVRPLRANTTNIHGAGTYNTFGYTAITFHENGYQFFSYSTFDSKPEEMGTVTATELHGAAVYDNVVIDGTYNGDEFIVLGFVTAIDDSTGTGTIDVDTPYHVVQGGR